MSRIEKFKIDEFTLQVDHGSFLVEVTYSDEPGQLWNSVEELPAWVFQSRYAIWLTTGNDPIRVRALEGEQIKQALISRFPRILSA